MLTITKRTAMSSTAAEATVAMIKTIPDGDPVVDAAKWVALILVILGSATYPFMLFMRKKNRDNSESLLESTISKTGSTLYTQLLSQVEEYRKIAESATKERQQLFDRIHALELEAAEHKHNMAVYRASSEKLAQKDADIASLITQAAAEREKFLDVLKEKENAITLRDARILQLEQSVRALQIRIARDEERSVFKAHVCPFAAAKAKGRSISPEIDQLLAEHSNSVSEECSTIECGLTKGQ